ncbi:TIM barrel protein [Tautonia sp. JC769]|uniref:sugar phosphate isomerase/epimerase family protein n=1 Tax=Tautonia sp. JC769 TaxID=3232135 RepID=UPI00345760D2
MWPSLSLRMLGLGGDARSAIELASRFGFQGVELLVRDLVEQHDDALILGSMMSDLGLRAGTWPLPMDWRGDRDRFRRDLAQLPAYARVAEQLGLNRTGTWVLPEILDPLVLDQERPGDAAMGWHLERLVPIAKIVNDHGHRLGLEAIGVSSFRSGRGLRFIDRLEGLRPLLAALRDHGCDVGLTVDGFHLHAAEESPEIVRHYGADEVVSVHVSDMHSDASNCLAELRDEQRRLPSPAGRVPCRQLLRTLAELEYSGPVFPEPIVGGGGGRMGHDVAVNPEAIVEEAALALQSVWPSKQSAESE